MWYCRVVLIEGDGDVNYSGKASWIGKLRVQVTKSLIKEGKIAKHVKIEGIKARNIKEDDSREIF